MAFPPEVFIEIDGPRKEIQDFRSPIEVSGEEARKRIRVRIEFMAREVRRPLHIFTAGWHGLQLFSISSQDEFGMIYKANKVDQTETALLERGRLEAVAFEVMEEYGFAPNRYTEERSPHGTGIVHVRRIHSTNITGLYFDREANTGESTELIVETMYARNRAPFLNLNPNLKPAATQAR